MAALACVVGVLASGSALPAVLLGDGTDRYEGEDRAFAEYALLYDLDLKEWPFPIDPTVVRSVREVRSYPRSPDCPIDVDAYPGFGDDPDVIKHHSAEVVHYGPFFLVTGKTVIRCDGARTIIYPEVDAYSPFFFAHGLAVMGWALGVVVGVLVVPATLLMGGAWLLARGGGERADRVIGSVACVEGAILVLVEGMYFLA